MEINHLTAKMQWSLTLLFLMGQCFVNCQLYKYHYIRESKTWTEAQQYCREKHIDLATVTNMTDMKRLLSESPGNMREAWIGLFSKPEFNRTWYWSLPGLKFNESETKWKPGEPSDRGTHEENCGFVDQNPPLLLDTGCEGSRSFLCYDETNRTHKYHLIKEGMTWQKAQSRCREKHTDLVSGRKQLYDEELKNVMTSGNLYIGLFRDTWRWSDGNSSSFRRWTDEFKNQQSNRDQCAMTVFDSTGRWEVKDCTEKKPFICYDDTVILIKEKMTWEDALYYCRHHHHDLVTITNLDEQRWVQEKAKKASTDYVWMGLRYTCTLDFWFWVSDEVVRYKNWASDGPEDDCDMSGAMETRGGHQWKKTYDSEEFNFICSKH